MVRLAVFLLAFAAAPVSADEAGEANQHFEAGERAFSAGDYDAAVAEFLVAYRIKPHPDVLIDIATSYERIYHPIEARDYYERFLRDASEDSPFRPLALNRLRVLRALPGSILVESHVGARVQLAGEGRHLDGAAPHRFEQLPPGNYRIHVEAPEHVPADLSLKLEPGGQDVVRVPLQHQIETLTIFSKPDHARVFLDGREEGVTPFSRAIEVGRRKIRLEVEDFPPFAEEIDLKAGAPAHRNVTFRRPRRSGRTEMVLAGMVYGGLGSVVIAEAAGGPRLPDGGTRLGIDLAATGVGVGVGFLVTSLTTDDYVKVGHSSILIGSTIWGTVMGSSVGMALRLSNQDTLSLALLGSGLGLGSGLVVARVNDTSPGDAALANSGGMWGSMTGLLLARAIGFPGDDIYRATGWMVLGGCVVGITGGIFLGWGLEVSRAQVAVVDAFGLGGLALAFGVGYGVEPDDNHRLESGARWGLGGLAVGILGGAILARKLKNNLPVKDALIMHHEGRWAFGMPTLRVDGAMTPEGRDTRVLLSLAHGEF